MAWLEVDQTLPNHKKTMRLRRLLKVSKAEAVGMLTMLWLWSIDNAPDGWLDIEAEDIAEITGWERNADELLQGLIESGFLDHAAPGSPLRIHDYEDRIGRLIAKRQANAERMLWGRISSSMRPELLKAASFRCSQCGSADQPLEIDHVMPIARGGTNDLNNLQVLCRPCNRRKGARV